MNLTNYKIPYKHIYLLDVNVGFKFEPVDPWNWKRKPFSTHIERDGDIISLEPRKKFNTIETFRERKKAFLLVKNKKFRERETNQLGKKDCCYYYYYYLLDSQ